MASSNSITDYVPLENMQAMFDATYEFGRYPLDLKPGFVKGRIWTFQGKPGIEKHALATDLDVESYVLALLSSDVPRIVELVRRDLDSGMKPAEVISKGMVAGMTIIGEKFQIGEVFIPEMMIAAKTMSETLATFKEEFTATNYKKLGTVLIGTVRGDLHDIGKNLVRMTLEGQGFVVEDLGVSVSSEKFVRTIEEKKPDILALSALLTTTMIEMKNTISALRDAGLRDSVKIIVGGAPLTRAFADQIGADGYAYDAPDAARTCQALLSTKGDNV